MAEQLKWICISLSLILLLSLSADSMNIDQKWPTPTGLQYGYEGGFCLPGFCIGGNGGGRDGNYADNVYHHYGSGGVARSDFREVMYCKPVTCRVGSCDAFHLHMDKGLYAAFVSKNAAKHKEGMQSSTTDHIQRTFSKQYDVQEELKEAAMTPQSN